MDTLNPAIRPVRPEEPAVSALIGRHNTEMRAQTPPESCHVLTAEALSASDVRLYALFEGPEAIVMGALRLTGALAELKSMHTAHGHRGRGLGRRLLLHLLDEARARGAREVALETGAGPEHLAARALYASEGFRPCGPFGTYRPDPLSCFMSRAL